MYCSPAVKIDAGEDPTATLGSREESEEDNLTEMLEDLFAGVILATDPLDPSRQIHLAFRLLPSKKVSNKGGSSVHIFAQFCHDIAF